MEKLAVIGTGIAGMGSAYLLSKYYDVTVFEKNDYVGGHTNTISVPENDKTVNVDTGFMVFNYVTYPNLTKLFDMLNVEVMKTDMSFSVQDVESNLEFTGSGIDGLFAQRKNILNLRYIKMLFQINRFNKDAIKFLEDKNVQYLSLADFVNQNKYGDDFLYKYLIPMSSAVWSTPPDLMLKFPASTLLRFFYNHGFLGLDTQHQWFTVKGGSKNYRDKIILPYQDKIINDAVFEVIRENNKVIVKTKSGDEYTFDKVIIASHADDTLKMLKNPTKIEEDLLSKFKYQLNIATLHTDESVMPKTKKAWSSWNYRIENKNNETKTSTIYWMNSLQKVSDKLNYFVSISDPGNIDEKKILKVIDYDHPLFDVDAMKAQETLFDLNKQDNNTYFCGSYFKYGFHEDAFKSAVDLSNFLTNNEAWK